MALTLSMRSCWKSCRRTGTSSTDFMFDKRAPKAAPSSIAIPPPWPWSRRCESSQHGLLVMTVGILRGNIGWAASPMSTTLPSVNVDKGFERLQSRHSLRSSAFLGPESTDCALLPLPICRTHSHVVCRSGCRQLAYFINSSCDAGIFQTFQRCQ